MSDQSQGPGWWQASDGQWYPPESRAGVAAPPPQYVAPPPAKKGRGCLLGGLVGVGGVVLLIGLLIVVAIVVVVAAGGDDDKGKITRSVEPGRGTDENPAVDDIKITSCTPGAAPLNYPEAKGEILNHSSKASTYTFTVSFEVNGQRVAEGVASANAVAPNQTVAWTSIGVASNTAATIECKVVDVNRFAS